MSKIINNNVLTCSEDLLDALILKTSLTGSFSKETSVSQSSSQRSFAFGTLLTILRKPGKAFAPIFLVLS